MRNRITVGNIDTGYGYETTYESENGSVITETSRIELAQKNKQENQKYNKEQQICKDLADYGHNVIHLDDTKSPNGSYDILLDGRKADLKRMKGANNIYREGKSAVQKQGADLVVFKFDQFTVKMKREITKLQEKGIHGYYYTDGESMLTYF